jgi:16S rRNA (guanine527-N7)-methyltransferase
VTSREFAVKLERRIQRADVLMPAPHEVAMLEAYYTVLSQWNARINLTSLPLNDAPPETIDRLIIEPLAAARHVPEGIITWVDLGSGGGSPAVPLKIIRPAAMLTMVEATTKKATFLKEVIRQLQLPDARVENLRIEELGRQTTLKGTVDLVTARAVRMTTALFEVVRLLLGPKGRLHLFAARTPEVSDSSGFGVEAVHKLGSGLETKLIVFKSTEAGTHTVPSMPALIPKSVPRGTSMPLAFRGPSRRLKKR